jgi:CHC2 zinc finger
VYIYKEICIIWSYQEGLRSVGIDLDMARGGAFMDDKPKDWVDFAKAKAVRFEVALEALGLMGSLRRDGEQLQGLCPLHKASGDKESFGVHIGKQTFNCFACKKHGKVLDFSMQFKGIGAKEAAVWLMSLVDKGEVQTNGEQAAAGGQPAASEVQESVQVESSSNGAGEVKTALIAEHSIQIGATRGELTERE